MIPATFAGLLTGTTSLIAHEIFGSIGAACPRDLPAFWSAIAQIAEKIGVERLVPPIPAKGVPNSTQTTPVFGSPSAEISGSILPFPGNDICHAGFAIKVLSPPPEPPIFPSWNGGSRTSFVAKERIVAL